MSKNYTCYCQYSFCKRGFLIVWTCEIPSPFYLNLIPRWPAMVESDPDFNTYFELVSAESMHPVYIIWFVFFSYWVCCLFTYLKQKKDFLSLCLFCFMKAFNYLIIVIAGYRCSWEDCQCLVVLCDHDCNLPCHMQTSWGTLDFSILCFKVHWVDIARGPC